MPVDDIFGYSEFGEPTVIDEILFEQYREAPSNG